MSKETTKPKKLIAKAGATAKRPATRRAAAPKRPAYTGEDIALRAYFIHEERIRAGRPGDSDSDWIEAERQLAAESAAKKTAPRRKKTDG